MVGVASKPVEPPPHIFLKEGKTKFVENLKFIGAIFWKLLITAMYRVSHSEMNDSKWL